MSRHNRKIRLVPIDLDSFDKHERLRIHPKFVLVAFGDTIKFREWEELYLVSSWESWRFVERLYKEFSKIRNGSTYVKPLADGFMAVKELVKSPRAQVCQVNEFLRRCCRLVEAVNKLIKGLPSPRPDGFRMRVVAGYVGRLEVVEPRVGNARKVDYTGKPISLAFSLLAVEPHEPCICYQNVKALADLDRREHHEILFERLEKARDRSRRVARKDLQSLWLFTANNPRQSRPNHKLPRTC